MILEFLHIGFKTLAKGPGATTDQINKLKTRFPSIPIEFARLVEEATEIELHHENGQYIRIWGPNGCSEMDTAYGISKRIPGAIPIGDDGGGNVIFYLDGLRGFGLYHVGYGNLNAEDAVFVATDLTAFLQQADGINTF